MPIQVPNFVNRTGPPRITQHMPTLPLSMPVPNQGSSEDPSTSLPEFANLSVIERFP